MKALIDGNITEITSTEWDEFQAYKKSQAKEWPQQGCEYWFVDSEGDVMGDDGYSVSSHIDVQRTAIGNIYRTEAEAQAKVKKLKAEARIRKYIKDNGLEVAAPTDIVKWAMSCDSQNGRFEPAAFGAYCYGGDNITFQCRDHAQQVIDDCTDDLKTLFGI